VSRDEGRAADLFFDQMAQWGLHPRRHDSVDGFQSRPSGLSVQTIRTDSPKGSD
jgi:hypothetical protein